ncbi:MAG: hypothetical protein WCP32_12230 [Bacteroidota bacterium]
MININITEYEKQLYELLQVDIKIDWSFDEIENWFIDAEMTKGQKKYIRNLIMNMKKKKASAPNTPVTITKSAYCIRSEVRSLLWGQALRLKFGCLFTKNKFLSLGKIENFKLNL